MVFCQFYDGLIKKQGVCKERVGYFKTIFFIFQFCYILLVFDAKVVERIKLAYFILLIIYYNKLVEVYYYGLRITI